MTDSIFYEKGYALALQNAKTLYKSASQIVEQSFFGLACSLNILSAEEALKASFLLIKKYNPTGHVNEFDKIFYKHGVKHEQLRQYVEFQTKMQSDLKYYLDSYLPYITILNEMPPAESKQSRQMLKEINQSINLFKKHSNLSLDIDGILNWLENANTDKNRGFYVDKVNLSWYSPTEIAQEKYEKERQYTTAIIEYVESIEQLFAIQAKIKSSS